MSNSNSTKKDSKECPLCLEVLEPDDLNFYPCTCTYQVCRFCWNRIITSENGLCPACRRAYNSEEPASFLPISTVEFKQNIQKQRRPKSKVVSSLSTTTGLHNHNLTNQSQSPQSNLSSVNNSSSIFEPRRDLVDKRVLQENLLFVVNLPPNIPRDENLLKGPDYFGRYGEVLKVVLNLIVTSNKGLTNTYVITNQLPTNQSVSKNSTDCAYNISYNDTASVASSLQTLSGSASNQPVMAIDSYNSNISTSVSSQFISAYITYRDNWGAMVALIDMNAQGLCGVRPIKVSLGTTKYCAQFLRGSICNKRDCMYLHERGPERASFTREDMAANKHTQYEAELLKQFKEELDPALLPEGHILAPKPAPKPLLECEDLFIMQQQMSPRSPLSANVTSASTCASNLMASSSSSSNWNEIVTRKKSATVHPRQNGTPQIMTSNTTANSSSTQSISQSSNSLIQQQQLLNSSSGFSLGLNSSNPKNLCSDQQSQQLQSNNFLIGQSSVYQQKSNPQTHLNNPIHQQQFVPHVGKPLNNNNNSRVLHVQKTTNLSENNYSEEDSTRVISKVNNSNSNNTSNSSFDNQNTNQSSSQTTIDSILHQHQSSNCHQQSADPDASWLEEIVSLNLNECQMAAMEEQQRHIQEINSNYDSVRGNNISGINSNSIQTDTNTRRVGSSMTSASNSVSGVVTSSPALGMAPPHGFCSPPPGFEDQMLSNPYYINNDSSSCANIDSNIHLSNISNAFPSTGSCTRTIAGGNQSSYDMANILRSILSEDATLVFDYSVLTGSSNTTPKISEPVYFNHYSAPYQSSNSANFYLRRNNNTDESQMGIQYNGFQDPPTSRTILQSNLYNGMNNGNGNICGIGSYSSPTNSSDHWNMGIVRDQPQSQSRHIFSQNPAHYFDINHNSLGSTSGVSQLSNNYLNTDSASSNSANHPTWQQEGWNQSSNRLIGGTHFNDIDCSSSSSSSVSANPYNNWQGFTNQPLIRSHQNPPQIHSQVMGAPNSVYYQDINNSNKDYFANSNGITNNSSNIFINPKYE